MLDWLRLIRASGLATILSNTLAAVLVSAGDGLNPKWFLVRLHDSGSRVLWVLLASCLLYATGMLWNDLHDVEVDRIQAPRRPLPSGRIACGTALVVGVVLAICALLAAGAVPEHGMAFNAAGVVLTLILLYDFAAKEVPWAGSVVMALVRAAHACFVLLMLGPEFLAAAVLPSASAAGHWLPGYALILGLYIFGLTLVSELESRPARRWELLTGGAAMIAATALAVWRVSQAPWIHQVWRYNYGPPAVVAALLVMVAATVALVLMVGQPYLAALRGGKQELVGPVLFKGLAGIILLDAVVATSAHPLGALVVLPLFLMFRGISRMIRMD
jgi:4-hydroxybenzoate polyprenyltransferase